MERYDVYQLLTSEEATYFWGNDSSNLLTVKTELSHNNINEGVLIWFYPKVLYSQYMDRLQQHMEEQEADTQISLNKQYEAYDL